ncbi:MAG: response regulator transcription factor [Chloroflexi bacterium]|nr:response regulator transcription factor [Chloroflexota bacterium]
MIQTNTILLVEGRKPTTEYLAPVLNGQGQHVVTARTRRDALAKVQEVQPAVIVLDSPSLRFSCRRFCKTLRDTALDIPVLMLLPEGAKIDRSIGARAHLRYPFSAKKLTNRVVRLLPAPDDDLLQAGDVTLNIKQRCVVRGDRETHLTPKQASLLEVFLRHPGEILTRAYLMKQVWDTEYMGDTRTLDVHIHWVRIAIEDNHKSPVYLRTIRRVGYCFQAPQEPKKSK